MYKAAGASIFLKVLKLPSYAKINLHLDIFGRRQDGFHELCTVFQTISLCDEIFFEPADEFTLAVAGRAPAGPANIVTKAAQMLAERAGVRCAAAVRLKKHIPSPGGLGGGSSNAATVLIGLSRLWGIRPSEADLYQLAAELGSDTPFFLTGGTAAAGGRGEIIEPLEDVRIGPMLVVTPPVDVMTAEAFKALDARVLTISDEKSNLLVCRAAVKKILEDPVAGSNGFENTVFAAHPEIERVKFTLTRNGAVHSLMSGSGASVFGIFDTEETRQTALKALDHEVNWRKFAVAAISRIEYREALQIVY